MVAPRRDSHLGRLIPGGTLPGTPPAGGNRWRGERVAPASPACHHAARVRCVDLTHSEGMSPDIGRPSRADLRLPVPQLRPHDRSDPLHAGGRSDHLRGLRRPASSRDLSERHHLQGSRLLQERLPQLGELGLLLAERSFEGTVEGLIQGRLIEGAAPCLWERGTQQHLDLRIRQQWRLIGVGIGQDSGARVIGRPGARGPRVAGSAPAGDQAERAC